MTHPAPTAAVQGTPPAPSTRRATRNIMPVPLRANTSRSIPLNGLSGQDCLQVTE